MHKVFDKLGQETIAKQYSFGQVEAVIFTEDMKRLYVTMKEGFPLEYVVSYLQVDTADQKYQIYKEYVVTRFFSVG